jgi:hypothetical protein
MERFGEAFDFLMMCVGAMTPFIKLVGIVTSIGSEVASV